MNVGIYGIQKKQIYKVSNSKKLLVPTNKLDEKFELGKPLDLYCSETESIYSFNEIIGIIKLRNVWEVTLN